MEAATCTVQLSYCTRDNPAIHIQYGSTRCRDNGHFHHFTTKYSCLSFTTFLRYSINDLSGDLDPSRVNTEGGIQRICGWMTHADLIHLGLTVSCSLSQHHLHDAF